MIWKRLLPGLHLSLAFAWAAAVCGQPATIAAREVLARLMPQLAPQFHLRLVERPGRKDYFRISGSSGHIEVEAATQPTLLFGLNWYLKYAARLRVLTNGLPLGAPGLTSDYYLPRWKMYFDSFSMSLKNNEPVAPIDWYAFGDRWNHSQQSYSAVPQGDPYAAALRVAAVLHPGPAGQPTSPSSEPQP